MVVMITSEEYKELVIKANKYDEFINSSNEGKHIENHIPTIESNFDNDIPEKRF